ncbi:MAG: hypothetical protein ACOYBE_00090 [Blautia sp.]|jgi:hypothetical protein
MTALLEFKQRLKNLYGQYEVYILPVLKCVLALTYFFWINDTIGFSEKLSSPFVVLILALICAILPSNAIVWLGYALIIGNCYSLGIEVAAFAVVLVLILAILFLRFSNKSNILMAFTPLGFTLKMPALIPIGGGLLSAPLAALPAGCSVVLYYFLTFLKEQSAVLKNTDAAEITTKIKLLVDGLMKNQEMWITVLAFVAVVLLVNLIRTRSLDYAWRIAIVVGGVTYILVMLAGGLFLNAEINIASQIIFTVVAVVLGLVLEFFAFGGDYTRTERLEYEDDEYFYYVKAVPKVSIATSKRKIKKINAEPAEPEQNREEEETVVEYANPIFEDDSWQEEPEKEEPTAMPDAPIQPKSDSPVPEIEKPEIDTIDFEKKLEESLKDL